MEKLKYEKLLDESIEAKNQLIKIPNFDKNLLKSYSKLINDLGEKASLEAEIFYNCYLNFDEFVEEFLEKIQLKTNNGDLLLAYYKKFDEIQISEIYKLINDPINYEEEFDPIEKFLIKNGFKY